MTDDEKIQMIKQALNEGTNVEPVKHYTPMQQIMLGAKDFWNSYQDMKNRNLKGFDKYAHARANAESTKRGEYGELTARLISYAREKLNKNIDPLFKKNMTWNEALQDSIADNKANVYGREQAKKYPNIPTHELLQKYWVKDETGEIVK